MLRWRQELPSLTPTTTTTAMEQRVLPNSMSFSLRGSCQDGFAENVCISDQLHSPEVYRCHRELGTAWRSEQASKQASQRTNERTNEASSPQHVPTEAAWVSLPRRSLQLQVRQAGSSEATQLLPLRTNQLMYRRNLTNNQRHRLPASA